ncbi:MAG: hypothetical protein KDC39_02140 [Actinobacteria bacterium]|nr:hypothetical protein [Actinomycetota bacterium]
MSTIDQVTFDLVADNHTPEAVCLLHAHSSQKRDYARTDDLAFFVPGADSVAEQPSSDTRPGWLRHITPRHYAAASPLPKDVMARLKMIAYH